MGTKVGQNWYQWIHYDVFFCRQVSFTVPQWTPSREEHILALSQQVGLVIFLSGHIFVLILCVTALVGVKKSL
jgi:hypothetical protein